MLALLPPIEGVPQSAMTAAPVVVLAIGLWATGALPEYMTALLFFLLAVTVGHAAPRVAFAGFYAGAAWLVLGGLVLGAAVQTTGLGGRIAARVVGRLGQSYVGLLYGVVAVAVVLGFLVPSATVRAIILVPLVLGLADGVGFVGGRRGRVGLALSAGAASYLPALTILPANVPNLGLMGAAESIYGYHPVYGDYLLLHFPVLGLGSALLIPPVIRVLFPDRTEARAEPEAAGPATRDQRALLVILLVALALWMTDVVHGVAPSWIALAAALLCMAPRIGVLPSDALVRSINLAPWIFVAGVIGMGAVVADSGLGDLIGRGLLSALSLRPGHDAWNFAAVLAIGSGMGVVTTMPGQPGVMTALAGSIAQATGWPLETVLMAETPSWSLVLFAYEVPPIVATIALAGLRVRDAVRFLIGFTVTAWIVLVPLQFLWWRALGMFG